MFTSKDTKANLKEDMAKKVSEFEIEDIGMESSSYFQGRGTAFSRWDDVAVGIGSNPKGALDDAFEQLASQGYDISPEMEKEASEYKETPEVGTELFISGTLNGQDVGSIEDTQGNAVLIGTSYLNGKEQNISEGSELDVDDGSFQFKMTGMMGRDEAISEFEEKIQDAGGSISPEILKELRAKLSWMEMNEHYYHVAVYVKSEGSATESIERKIKEIKGIEESINGSSRTDLIEAFLSAQKLAKAIRETIHVSPESEAKVNQKIVSEGELPELPSLVESTDVSEEFDEFLNKEVFGVQKKQIKESKDESLEVQIIRDLDSTINDCGVLSSALKEGREGEHEAKEILVRLVEYLDKAMEHFVFESENDKCDYCGHEGSDVKTVHTENGDAHVCNDFMCNKKLRQDIGESDEYSSEDEGKKWHIVDWTNKICFGGQQFDSFEDAEEFLSTQLGDKYEADREEYEIIPAKGSRETRYLDPKDPRHGQKAESNDSGTDGDLKLWEPADNYSGQHFDDYYVGPSRNRGSDVLTESNFETALEMLGGEHEPEVVVAHSSHWAVGWVQQILVHKDAAKEVEILKEIAKKLKAYPVLDDDDFSERESEKRDSDFEANSSQMVKELGRAIGIEEPKGQEEKDLEAIARQVYSWAVGYWGLDDAWASPSRMKKMNDHDWSKLERHVKSPLVAQLKSAIKGDKGKEAPVDESDDDKYDYYVVHRGSGDIHGGFENKEDAQDARKDMEVPASELKVVHHSMVDKDKKKDFHKRNDISGKLHEDEVAKPVQHTATITCTLKEVAEALGYDEWVKDSDYLDADSMDDVWHSGYSAKDVQNVHTPQGMDDVEKIFPSQVAMALENAERDSLAAKIGEARRDTLKEALEKIQPTGEYQSGDGEMISVRDCGVRDVSVDTPKNEVKITIENPEHVINDLVAGRGTYSPELDPYVEASDEEIKSGFLATCGDYFEIYGERKPEPSDRLDAAGIDDNFFKEEIDYRIGEMSIDDIAESVVDAVDAERIESEEEAIALAAKLSGKSKKEIGKAVEKLHQGKAQSHTDRANKAGKVESAGSVQESDLYSGLDELVHHYLIAALFSSTDNSNEQGGDPLNDNYDIKDIAPESIEKAKKDCASFEEKAKQAGIDINSLKQGIDHVGHDFWLTRNRHGAGFWDGDYPEDIGEKLTEISHEFGECDMVIGDDGKIYIEGGK